jgi:hypothetical protein
VSNDADLKLYYKGVTNQTHIYGHIVYDEIEKSIDSIEGRLELTMAIEAVTVENGETKANTSLGTWLTGPNNEIKVLDQDNFLAMRSLDVVRVVVVVVRWSWTRLEIVF